MPLKLRRIVSRTTLTAVLSAVAVGARAPEGDVGCPHSGNTYVGTGVTVGFGVIDTTAPETLITAGPAEAASIFERNVMIAWSGTDDQLGGLTFSQRLDNELFSSFDAVTSRTLIG